jgi:hypothetical protein
MRKVIVLSFSTLVLAMVLLGVASLTHGKNRVVATGLGVGTFVGSGIGLREAWLLRERPESTTAH